MKKQQRTDSNVVSPHATSLTTRSKTTSVRKYALIVRVYDTSCRCTLVAETRSLHALVDAAIFVRRHVDAAIWNVNTSLTGATTHTRHGVTVALALATTFHEVALLVCKWTDVDACGYKRSPSASVKQLTTSEVRYFSLPCSQKLQKQAH